MKKYLNVLQSTKTNNIPSGWDSFIEFYYDTDYVNAFVDGGVSKTMLFMLTGHVSEEKHEDSFLYITNITDDSKFLEIPQFSSSYTNPVHTIYGYTFTDSNVYNLGVKKIQIYGKNIYAYPYFFSKDIVEISKIIIPNVEDFKHRVGFGDQDIALQRLQVLPTETNWPLNESFIKLFRHTGTVERPPRVIPENLFSTAANAKSFEQTFYNTKSYTIPENLFANCSLLTNVMQTFSGNSALTAIPENLFANNPLITNFTECFAGCTSVTGKLPELWKTHPSATGTGCFRGCTNASNYSSVPTNWKT